MSKTLAPKTPARKTATAKSAPAAKKVAHSATGARKQATTAHKPAVKKPLPVKAAPAKRHAAATTKAAVKKALPVKAPPARKHAVAKPAPIAAHARKPAAAAPKPAPAPATTPKSTASVPPKAAAPAPARRKTPRPVANKYAAQPVAPLPLPTSRFADRFAPPRPPTREMNKLEHDVPHQALKADPKLANAWKTKTGRDLSEPELLAMPDSEYMNDRQLEFFRARLQQLKDEMLSNAEETTENLREDSSIVPDPADRATIEEEHALELRTRDRERKLLKKISQSLVRLDSGDYGFCDETGEAIGLGRLIARPTATLSLEAQQRRELKQKMFGD